MATRKPDLSRLLEVIEEGGGEAGDRLWGELRAWIIGRLRANPAFRSRAEDIAHDVLVMLLERPPGAEIRNTEAYLRVAIDNRGRDHSRSAARTEVRDAHEMLEHLDASEGGAVPPEASANVFGPLLPLVRRLPPWQRRIILLRHFAGYDWGEIAQGVGSEAGSVRSGHTRACKALDREIAQLRPQDPSLPDPRRSRRRWMRRRLRPAPVMAGRRFALWRAPPGAIVSRRFDYSRAY